MMINAVSRRWSLARKARMRRTYPVQTPSNAPSTNDEARLRAFGYSQRQRGSDMLRSPCPSLLFVSHCVGRNVDRLYDPHLIFGQSVAASTQPTSSWLIKVQLWRQARLKAVCAVSSSESRNRRRPVMLRCTYEARMHLGVVAILENAQYGCETRRPFPGRRVRGVRAAENQLRLWDRRGPLFMICAPNSWRRTEA